MARLRLPPALRPWAASALARVASAQVLEASPTSEWTVLLNPSLRLLAADEDGGLAARAAAALGSLRQHVLAKALHPKASLASVLEAVELAPGNAEPWRVLDGRLRECQQEGAVLAAAATIEQVQALRQLLHNVTPEVRVRRWARRPNDDDRADGGR